MAALSSICLLIRACDLIVGDRSFPGLRITFKVVKDMGKNPNTAEISVTNLSKDSRAHIQAKGLKIQLTAGYRQNQGVIFTGDTRTVDHTRQGANWVTKLTSGDGERAMGADFANMSFAPGAKLSDVVEKLLGSSTLDTSDAARVAQSVPGELPQGKSVYGPVIEQLSGLLAPSGHSLSVQNGRVQIQQGNAAATQTAPILLSPTSGLVGSPEHGSPEKEKDNPLLKFKSLLRPELTPGGRVAISSESTNGLFVIQKLTHSGDTDGGEWYSECEALPA